NDISIEKTEQQTLTVEFFINRGFLDHYSAFLYTDDPGTIQTFDKEIMDTIHNTHRKQKLEENWYRVSY
ncbi:MAG: hypothetical protein JNM36_08040, partial [Chitinophagales bacterium]|nr:hypothetical protein [Chitinophagales bacterium]